VQLIDSHCHLSFDELSENLDAVIKRSIDAGVTGWITVGTDPEENRKCIELAEKHDNLYAAIGIHPHDARTVTADILDELKDLAQNPKVVAIGETGLDFHYKFSSPQEQIRAFAAQLRIAEELNLPVIIHCREAFERTIELLDEHGRAVDKIVFHCFSGSPEQAEAALDKGFYISFTGVVTFKNAQRTRAAASLVPLERMMVETDCPYMSPEPMRKQKINEPALLIHTASKLAELKGICFADFAEAVTATAREFFKLPVA